MSHLNSLYLPEGIETGAVYGPEFITEVAMQESGREFRNRVRQDSLRVGDLSFAPTLQEDYAALLAMFMICNGRYHSFRFTDPSDFECAIAEGVLVALSATTFQLYKVYTVGSATHLRLIQNPVAAGFVLEHNDTPLTLTSDYTLDDTTGIVTTVAVDYDAEDLTWSGPFDNAVRFDTDRMAASFAAAQVMAWGSIPIKEVLL